MRSQSAFLLLPLLLLRPPLGAGVFPARMGLAAAIHNRLYMARHVARIPHVKLRAQLQALPPLAIAQPPYQALRSAQGVDLLSILNQVLLDRQRPVEHPFSALFKHTPEMPLVIRA